MLMFTIIACILIVVLVPMIFGLIDKTRKQAFAKSVTEYINSVKTAYSTEELECYSGNSLVIASYLGDGTFYVPITTSESKEAPNNYAKENVMAYDEKIPNPDSSQTVYDIAKENATNIIGSKKKSPFGKDIYGYIKIVRKDFNTEYYARIVDSDGNGNSVENNEVNANSSESITKDDLVTYLAPGEQSIKICKFSE